MQETVDYKSVFGQTGTVTGWDFSGVKVSIEGVAWNFFDKVSKYCKPHHVVLDIGTGGGSKASTLAPLVQFLVGIDVSQEMIRTAYYNLHQTDYNNVKFVQMDSKELKFPDNFFNIVTCCHAPYDAKEVYQTLVKGGAFFTQQISEWDKINIKNAYGRGQMFGDHDGAFSARQIKELEQAGFIDVRSFDYQAKEYYKTPEDLMFLLKNTEIIPNFGEDPKDFEIFKDLVEKYTRPQGLVTNCKRYMLIAKK